MPLVVSWGTESASFLHTSKAVPLSMYVCRISVCWHFEITDYGHE